MKRSSVLATQAVAAAVALAWAGTSSVHASVHTWGSNGTSMNTPANWASGGVPPVAPGPASNVTLIFPGTATFAATNDIANPLIVQAMQFDGPYNFTLSGNPIQMSNLGAAPTLSGTGQNQNISADLILNATTTATTTGGGWLRFGGAISGTGTLVVNVAGCYFDNGATSNSANVTVGSGGLLYLNKGNNIAAVGSNLTINGGQVQDFYSNELQASTNLSISANGTFSAFNNEQCNNITLNTGSIGLSGTLALGGTIQSTGFATFASGGAINLGGTQHTINVVTPGLANELALSTNLTNGTFNKIGAGVLELSGFSNSFTGQNVVTAGTLRGTASSIGSNVLNNATVNLYSGSYSGNISGGGQVQISNFVQYLAAQSYSGGTFIDASGQLDGTTSTLTGTITASGAGAILSINQNTNGVLTALLAGPLQFQKYGTGIVTINNANTLTDTFSVYEGGVIAGASNAFGTATLQFSNGSSPVTLSSSTSVSLPNDLSFIGPLTVQGANNITVTSTSNKNDNFSLTHTSTGNTTIAGKFNLGASGSITVSAGTLTLGNPAAVGGFTAQGPVTVNSGGTLTLQSLNFVTLPDVTLNGGTLSTPNGYAIPLGAALQGNGTVSGRVASANGSTILATGNLVVGDATHAAGVNLDGELYTAQYTVTLNDSNQSVLGSLTKLGNGPGTPGTINTPNGAVLNFGRNLTGNGSVNSTNALAQAVIINGDVNGDSPSDLINFTGYVKGVGTFNNASFSGTFSPGLSPALLTVGTITFGATNVFDVEIGGLNRGSQFDALDVTGMLTLNGQLKVTLINAFNPSLGDSFDLINGSETGTFGSFNFPALSPGLGWDTSQLYTQGILKIVAVPEPATLALLALGGAMALGRGRQRARHASK